jgi:hypothetical protein
MRSDLPLTAVIGPILTHTPAYVWVILAALVVLGGLQLRSLRIARTRLLVAPVAMAALSLWGASSAFGPHAGVLAAWAVGMTLALAANRRLRWPRDVRVEGDAFVVPGSPWPLALMLAIFMLRYAVAVTLVFHPDWRAEPAFAAGMALLYGALSGLFTARSVRILASRPRARLAVA